MKGCHHGAVIEIKNGNIVGTGVCDVSAVSVGRNVDKVRTTLHPDGIDDLVLLGVDHADIRRSGVNNIDFVALGVGSESGRIGAHLQRLHHRESLDWIVCEIDYRDGVALAIRDIGVFVITRSIKRKAALGKVIPSSGKHERNNDGDEEKFAHKRRDVAEGRRLSDMAKISRA